jgi:hypothetical protein
LLASFLVDRSICVPIFSNFWLIFIIFHITAFFDNPFNTWCVFAMTGSSLILFLYYLSFLFSFLESASRQGFVFMTILLPSP